VSHDRWRDDLRAAQDANAVSSLLEPGLPADGLQHAGDAVLAVLCRGPEPDLDEVVTALRAALRERFWDGDTELADALDHAAGHGESLLKPIGVDLNEVAEALEQAGSEALLDLPSGEVWAEPAIEYSREADEGIDFDERGRWLVIFGEGSRESYRDMQQFIATLDDDDLAERLTDAIDGKGAFHRFYNVLERRDPDTLTRWHRYHDDARIGRARSWLADRGYRPQPPAHD
jgi:hypothetical protein